MQEVKKHEHLNNINSMKIIFSIAEFLNYLGLLIVLCIFIYKSSLVIDFLDLATIGFFIIYIIPIIINIIIIRIYKKGFESINSLFGYLLQSINEIENKTK